MKIVTKKTIKRECWDLDYSLIKWLNEHLKVYYSEAVRMVDLGFHKFNYKGVEYTEEQIIIRMIGQKKQKIYVMSYMIYLK